MGDNESSFPVQGLIIGPSMALFDRAQYGHEGRFCSRDFIELFILKLFFVRICRVFYGSQGQMRSLFFCM